MSEEHVDSNVIIPETAKGLGENCIFCDIIAKNDPNTIIEPRVSFILIHKTL